MSTATSQPLHQSADTRSSDFPPFKEQANPDDSPFSTTATDPSTGPQHQFVQPSDTTKSFLPDPYLLDQYSYSYSSAQQHFPNVETNTDQDFPSVLGDYPDGAHGANPDQALPDTDDRGPTTPSPTTSHPEFLSPTEYSDNFATDLSAHASPGEGSFFREADFGLIAEFPADQLEFPDSRPANGSLSYPISKRTDGSSHASQLLSPVLTDTPSPSLGHQTRHTESSISRGGSLVPEAMAPFGDRLTRGDVPAHNSRHTPTFTTSPCSDQNLDVQQFARNDRPTSPIVKVSSYSRGDSPARTGRMLGGSSSKRNRPGHSSNHLAPAEDPSSDESGDETRRNESPQFATSSLPPGALRSDDGSWIPDSISGQAGLDPESRGDLYVPSIKELEEQRQRDEKNAEVRHWLTVSEANSEIDDDDPPPSTTLHRRKGSTKNRRRAKSAGDPSYGRLSFDDTSIPGPGVLLDEESGVEDDDEDEDDDYESDEDVPESPPANVGIYQEADYLTEKFPSLDLDESQLEPLPRQFIRARPWQDPPSNAHVTDSKKQPDTANAAMVLFGRKADNIETASRAATWGTRRLSESDVNSVVGSDGILKNFSIGRGRRKSRPEKPERKSGNFLERASGLLPKRSNSNIKRKMMESMQQHSSSESVDKPKKRDSFGTPRLPQRKASFGRTKSPSLNTGGAVLAMTGQIAAIGGSGSVCPPSPVSGQSSWSHFRKRSRSKSEIPKGSKPAGSGLAEQMSNHGDSPAPKFTTPQDSRATPLVSPSGGKHTDEDDDEDDDDGLEQKGVAMDFPIPTETIIPTLEGFKTHIKQLNPRLPPFLIERISQEQLRRHQKLMLNKARHVHAVSQGKCGSGKHCFALGGEATLLPPRPSARDPEATYAQFQVTGTGNSDGESSAPADGSVTAALFPPGVPLPPVKRLPAEFECSLCFKVKKFQKPSDWTKHVHEDVQPFTCTFPKCAEPKSFKRKADWVRHENERHRQLEWWTCNIPDCTHTCYRKDNFVQHLVREHKKPEPKVKTSKSRGSGSSKAKQSQSNGGEGWEQSWAGDREVEQMWKLVEKCRHDTTKRPQDEPCRFCGNICNSWKKLTVHLAKHMEQIAMPVLNLVMQRDVSPNTVISPVQQSNGVQPRHQHQNSASPMNSTSQNTISPVNDSSPYSGRSPFEGAIGNVPQQQFYAAQSDGYDIPQNSPYGGQIQMGNGGGMPGPSQATSNMDTSALATAYNLSHYSQSNSSSMMGQPVFSNTTQPRAFSNSPNAATYPPPYNAVSRQQAGVQHPAPVTIPPASYGLEMAPVTSNSIYDGSQPQIYTSPVDNAPYSYQTAPDGMGQAEAMYDTSGMGDPAMQQMGNYMQGSGAGYQNQ